jgi:CRP/FNR family transcriptional regulator, cyclic AMP receptor protein
MNSTTDETYEQLIKIPWFQELEPGDVRKFAEISSLRNFKAGEVFFHEGDKQDFSYVVLTGRVVLDMFVPNHGKVRFYTCEEWDNFGWSGVTPVVRTRTAGAVGVVAGTVIATDTVKLQALCDQDHDIGYLFMRRMTSVIASRLLVTRLQLVDMFAKPAETKTDE